MESWFFVMATSLCVCALLKSVINILIVTGTKLPPGARRLPVVGNLWLLLRKSFSFTDIELILRDIKNKKGPIITFWIRSTPNIFIASHKLAHKALVQNGAVFSHRLQAPVVDRVFNSNMHNIASAGYGPTWRTLGRNLITEMLHPSRIRTHSSTRKWVLDILVVKLKSVSDEPVRLMDHIQYAIFSLLARMCFGENLSETEIKKIEAEQRKVVSRLGKLNVINLFPRLGKIIFRKKWKEFLQVRQDQENVMIPLIEARIEAKHLKQESETVAYVDSLVDLQLPDEKRKLNMGEIVSICSEFLAAGTDTTATTFQWIMANLVKFPEIQEKVYQEIYQVMGETEMEGGFVNEENLQKLPYLKAVVMETLRRHPPAHFLLSHAVSDEVEFEGYVIPKNGIVNVMVMELGLDPNVWENPMEFKPERFLNSSNKLDQDGVDITGSREIKMMPFGAGRRICPAWAMSMLHLEYFVANLVWCFKWKPVDGNTDNVDLSERQEAFVVMKNPLQACISPRVKSSIIFK